MCGWPDLNRHGLPSNKDHCPPTPKAGVSTIFTTAALKKVVRVGKVVCAMQLIAPPSPLGVGCRTSQPF